MDYTCLGRRLIIDLQRTEMINYHHFVFIESPNFLVKIPLRDNVIHLEIPHDGRILYYLLSFRRDS